MNVRAPAKINLWLSVGRRRGDGYHDIVSIMQSVSLFDELTVEPSGTTTLDVTPPGAAPEDESNLVVKAVRAMSAASGASSGVAITLRKEIPSGAGLAGGSADAAATLVALNEIWGRRLSRKALERIGASIGADVPFCVRGGTALARGAGSDLSPLASPEALWWVIASDGSALATADVYAEFDRISEPRLDDPAELADALARSDTDAIAAGLRNDLTDAALSRAPDIARVRDALRDAGALGVVMTGSGSAWCGLARDEEHARDVASGLGELVVWCRVASSSPRGPRVVGEPSPNGPGTPS